MRKKFDKEFKKSTVQMMIDQNKSAAQTARELDISPNTIHNWKKKYEQEFITKYLPQLPKTTLKEKEHPFHKKQSRES
ncbi:transposase-like protein [Scopulibacillus daqui]|uniref:Transposase-like protein n=1 Tax=Scopulibacillus daqui TaxID=1469162 RepID=A0ABS2Q422_9BACL|nr:transposase [Scopulibacillus daqui]MBM7647049.1 transposase-like protein [Scopulibacillus daqui]